MGGLPGILGAPGFAPTGGAGFGFALIGGGGFVAWELGGLELAGVESVDAPLDKTCFFQGAVDPLLGATPGNTATGAVDAPTVRDLNGALVDVVAGTVLTGAGGGRRAAGGGGGGAGTAFGFGGTSSR